MKKIIRGVFGELMSVETITKILEKERVRHEQRIANLKRSINLDIMDMPKEKAYYAMEESRQVIDTIKSALKKIKKEEKNV